MLPMFPRYVAAGLGSRQDTSTGVSHEIRFVVSPQSRSVMDRWECLTILRISGATPTCAHGQAYHFVCLIHLLGRLYLYT